MKTKNYISILILIVGFFSSYCIGYTATTSVNQNLNSRFNTTTGFSRFNNSYGNSYSNTNYTNTSNTGSISQNAHYRPLPPPMPPQQVIIPAQSTVQYIPAQPGVSNKKIIYTTPSTYIQQYPAYPQQPYTYTNTYIPGRVYTTTSTTNYTPITTQYINNGNGSIGTITTQQSYTTNWTNGIRRFLSW